MSDLEETVNASIDQVLEEAVRSGIFDLEIAPLTTTPVWANPSPITGYTYLNGRAVGSRWNPLGPCLQFDAIGTAQAAISFGGSTHQMRLDMQTILGTAQAVAPSR